MRKSLFAGVVTVSVAAAGPWWATVIILAIVGGIAVMLSPDTQENTRLVILYLAALTLTSKAHERLCKSLRNKESKK